MAILNKITKLKNLGVYTDFDWGSDLPEFKQYNVIYGWNGTGKTTLSMMLGALNRGSHPEFPTLEYSVVDSDGNSHTQGSEFATKVKVFNSEFISNNVDFNQLSSKTIAVVLGEENKEILDAIEADEKMLDEVKAQIIKKTTSKRTKEAAYGTAFTDIARTISQGTQGAIVRNYNKTNAETAFNAITVKEILSQNDITALSRSVVQEIKDRLDKLSLNDATFNLASIITNAKTLLDKTVEANIIARLKDNSDISNWVETGLEVHTRHKSKTCEFCGHALDHAKIKELTDHFNEADAELKSNVDTLTNALREVYSRIDSLMVTDKANLYKEYQDHYKVSSEDFAKKKTLALKAITEFGKLINSKKAHTTEKIAINQEPSLKELVDSLVELNGIISEHNKKTDQFDERRKDDSQKIEKHYLSTIYDDVKKIENEIENLKGDIKTLSDGEKGKIALETRIAENRAKISSSHKACGMLNGDIKKFLGHDEITFRVNADETGYDILRKGDSAKNLSEGERTAIAFVFFITHIKEEGFDPNTGIIVVDDPVSSLDANSQFQAFSFLKEATKNASQLFLLTHNFEFLKLVLYWVRRYKSRRSLYMIKNSFSLTDGKRTGASLVKLDTSLERYESEYHYLFNLVYSYNDDGTIENAYKMPNVARKLLDSFLMFRVPKNVDTYTRLQELDFDDEKKSAIYKFTNDQSHITGAGFDPSLVPETQKCLKYLQELMETTFPEHYKYLIDSID
jgi:wobble nucleotide-excising tRNase